MKLSIITPCFNHGNYILEAVNSTADIEGIEFEVIIVDDGSIDEYTLIQLDVLRNRGTKIIIQENSGPASARNIGISIAKGEYILPLDADNVVSAEYIYKALSILETSKYEIVYANPIFIGNHKISRAFTTKAFSFETLLINNYIDTCAVFKKKVWEELGGYDVNLPFRGQEDWEFWIHAHLRGFSFFHLNESLFYYRIVENSISDQLSEEMQSKNHQYILNKHFTQLYPIIFDNYKLGLTYKKDLKNPLRSVMKYLKRFLFIK